MVAQPLRPLMESVVELHDMPGIELSLMAQEVAIEADEDQLLQAALQFDSSCATGHSDRGGSIVLKADDRIIEVKDDGPGMLKEVADRAFEPRFTTRGSGSGWASPLSKPLRTATGGASNLRPSPTGARRSAFC